MNAADSIPGDMSVQRLLETDPCPCLSSKLFAECCREEPKEGMTPENTLHLLFRETDLFDRCTVCQLKIGLYKPPASVVERDRMDRCEGCGECTCGACSSHRAPLSFYAVMTQKMNGQVPAEEIVASIAKRLWSPTIQKALERLPWKHLKKKGDTFVVQTVDAGERKGALLGDIAPGNRIYVNSNEPSQAKGGLIELQPTPIHRP